MAGQEERGQRRLQFLLKQAEVFQHFAPAASEKEKKCAPSPAHAVMPLMPLHATECTAGATALEAVCLCFGSLDLDLGFRDPCCKPHKYR